LPHPQQPNREPMLSRVCSTPKLFRNLALTGAQGRFVLGAGLRFSGRLCWLQVQHEVSAALSRLKMAANGADVVAVDIAGPVSTASHAVPATPEEIRVPRIVGAFAAGV
jgi:hypothetical protein